MWQEHQTWQIRDFRLISFLGQGVALHDLPFPQQIRELQIKVS
jgi:hypothetical protein